MPTRTATRTRKAMTRKGPERFMRRCSCVRRSFPIAHSLDRNCGDAMDARRMSALRLRGPSSAAGCAPTRSECPGPGTASVQARGEQSRVRGERSQPVPQERELAVEHLVERPEALHRGIRLQKRLLADELHLHDADEEVTEHRRVVGDDEATDDLRRLVILPRSL